MFELDKKDVDHMYFELYHMDGCGLADYINEWVKDAEWEVVSTHRGSSVSVKIRDVTSEEVIFEEWSEWMHYTANYFDVFIEAWRRGVYDSMNITNEDQLKELFVWSACIAMLIVYKIRAYTNLIEAPFEGNVFVFPYLPIR